MKIVNDSKMGGKGCVHFMFLPNTPQLCEEHPAVLPSGSGESGKWGGEGAGVGVGKGEELSYAHSLTTVHCLWSSSQ